MRNDSNYDVMRMRSLVLLALSCMASMVCAVDFPSATGDVALASDWGGSLPAVTDSVRFAVDGGAYTASDDVQFAAMTVTAKNVQFNMDVDEGGEPRSLKFKSFMAPSYGQTITLNGGIWDFQGGFFSLCNKNQNRQSSRQIVEIDGGAIVTNVGLFRIAYRDNYNTLRLSNGSKMYFSKCDWDYGAGKSNAVEVLSGSELVASSYIRDSYYSSGDGTYTHNRFVVSGEGSKIRLTGTAKTSGWEAFALGATYAGGSLTVADGGRVESALNFVMGKGSKGWESTAHVLSGGTMNISTNVIVGSAESTFGHVLAVSNSSSLVSMTGNLSVGSGINSYGNRVIVADGGEISAPSGKLFLGSGAGSYSNTLYVVDGGILTVSSECKMGEGAGSHDNAVIVSGGGTFNAGNSIRISDSTTAWNNNIYVTDGGSFLVVNKVHLGGYSSDNTKGGHNNSIYVSNGTFRCSAVDFGMSATSVSNKLVVSGSETDFGMTYSNGSLGLFEYGGWHEMVLSDGASWQHKKQIYVASNSFSNRFVVTRGASFSVQDAGLSSGSGAVSHANIMEISDGASARVSGRIELTKKDNAIVVSNATLQVGENLYVGRTISNVEDGDISGNRFEIYGSNTVVSVGGEFKFFRDSVLRINLPKRGYVGNLAPVRVGTFVINSTATFDIEGISEMRQCSERDKSRIPLVCSDSGVTVPAGIVESVNASFVSAGAVDCCIYVSDDGKNLMLKVPFRKGSVFIVR